MYLKSQCTIIIVNEHFLFRVPFMIKDTNKIVDDVVNVRQQLWRVAKLSTPCSMKLKHGACWVLYSHKRIITLVSRFIDWNTPQKDACAFIGACKS